MKLMIFGVSETPSVQMLCGCGPWMSDLNCAWLLIVMLGSCTPFFKPELCAETKYNQCSRQQ